VVERLLARGYEVPLVYATELPGLVEQLEALVPGVEVALSFALHGAVPPRGTRARFGPPRASDVEALSPWEAVTLQMMDRRNYDGKPVQELRAIYLRYVSLWRGLIEAHRPQAVLFHGTPHQGHDFVLYQLCRKDGIQTIMAERTYLNECLFLRRHLQESVCPPAAEVAAARCAADDQPLAGELNASSYDALNRDFNDLRSIRRELAWWRLAAFFVNPRSWPAFAGRIVNSIHGLSQRRPRRVVFRWQEARGRLRIRRGLAHYYRLAAAPDLNQPYVYFPLHYQPERTTVPDGGRFSDQLLVAEVLAAGLPAGWKLYVKEHPRQFRRGVSWSKVRSVEFYDRLAAQPGLQLVPLEHSSHELIARSRAVATVTGTSGWEAVQGGKPALVFGFPWYLHAPGVHAVRDAAPCRELLSQLAAGEHAVDRGLVRAYARLVRSRYGFRACFSDTLLRMSPLRLAESAEAFAAAYDRALRTGERAAPLTFEEPVPQAAGQER
jgi:hypothetical protein